MAQRIMQDRTLKWLSPLLYASGAWPRGWRADAARAPWGVVVTYHRVRASGEPIGNAWMESERGVDADTLRAHLAFLARHFTPVPLSDVAAPNAKSPGRPTFAVTFDDGYEDNLTVAAPILREMGIPATFFVVSEFVGTDKRFWWESLAEMCRNAEQRPVEMRPAVSDHGRNSLDRSKELRFDSREASERTYQWLSSIYRTLPHERVWPTLVELGQVMGVAPRVLGRDYRLMNWEQVLQLQALGFEIGGHTMTHANLGAGEPAAISREIVGCLEALQARLGRPVRSFAYPYGGPANRSETAIRALQAAGCPVAVTTDAGVIRPGTNRWLCPRIDLNKTWAFACAFNVERARRAGG